jgi:hypothetical protein
MIGTTLNDLTPIHFLQGYEQDWIELLRQQYFAHPLQFITDQDQGGPSQTPSSPSLSSTIFGQPVFPSTVWESPTLTKSGKTTIPNGPSQLTFPLKPRAIKLKADFQLSSISDEPQLLAPSMEPYRSPHSGESSSWQSPEPPSDCFKLSQASIPTRYSLPQPRNTIHCQSLLP